MKAPRKQTNEQRLKALEIVVSRMYEQQKELIKTIQELTIKE